MGRVIIFVLLVTLIVLKQLLWSLIIPIWQNPDEPSHFSYIQEMVETRQIPYKGHGTFSEELVKSMQFTHFMEIVSHPDVQMPIEEHSNTTETVQSRTKWTHSLNAADLYPPGYYVIASLGYNLFYDYQLIDRFYASRLMSILFYLGIVFFAYRFGKLAFPESKLLRILYLSLIMLNPMFSEMGAAVNNDVAVNFVGAALSFFLLLFLKGKLINWKQWVFYGFILAYGILSKPTVIFWYPVLAVVFFMNLTVLKDNLKDMVRNLAVFFIPQIVIVMWIIYFNWSHYGSLIGQSILLSGNYQSIPIFDAFYELIRFKIWEWFVITYWADFGWLDTLLPMWLYRLIKLAIAGLIFTAFIQIFRRASNTDHQRIIISAFVAHMIWVAIMFAIGYTSLTHGKGWFVQGRYFFPLILLYVYLLVIGFRNLVKMINYIWRIKELEFVLGILAVLSILLLHNYSLFVVVARRYYGF
jgi:hypothetical protein